MSKLPRDEFSGLNDPDAAPTASLGNAPDRTSARPKMPFTAFFGAIAFPGLGQLLVGCVRRGIGWCCLAFVLSVAALASFGLRLPVVVGAGLFAAYGIGRLVEFIDAVRCGMRPRWRYGNRFTRALLVVVLWIVGYWVAQGFAMVWRGHWIEAFVAAANAMMPAIVGETVEGVCPTCKRPTRVSAHEHQLRMKDRNDFPPDEVVGICAHCFAPLSPAAYPEGPLVLRTRDRFIVNKRLAPRRWDIIAFRVPFEPTNRFMMRVVGLPGETVELRDGEVTIDGRVLEKPPFLRGLRYVNSSTLGPPKLRGPLGWGDTGKPAKLGPDEYFVLGDFSQRSKDSRLFDAGAPGHPSYAVPADHIIGIVTQIYWPPDRWRTFERAGD